MENTSLLKTKKTDILSVDPRSIIIQDGFNVRQDLGDIEGLSQSIVESGLQVPLKVSKVRNKDEYNLIDGHRRMTAINLAIQNGHAIPYVQVTLFNGNKEDEVFAMIITGTGQKQLNEVEQAEAVKRLLGFDYTPEEIAKKIGKSVAHISNLGNIAKLSKKVKNKIIDGSVSATTILTISRTVKDDDEILKIIEDSLKANHQDGKVNRITTKKLVGVKFQTPMQKMNEVFQKLLAEDVSNDKVNLLDLLLNKSKELTADEIFEYFK